MSDKKDPEAQLHARQLQRVDDLIVSVKNILKHNLYMAKALWWLCASIALVSGMSGAGIATTKFSGTQLTDWVSGLLGVLAFIYPLLKCIDLEGKRGKYQQMVKFCSTLKDRLEETADRMRTIIDDNFSSDDEKQKWAEFVVFINATKRVVELFEIGVDDIQKELNAFHNLEMKLQRDAANFPLPVPNLDENSPPQVRQRKPLKEADS